jgi:hypothetical protein
VLILFNECGHFDETEGVLRIKRAVYEGTFGTPKTDVGRRQIP